MRGFLRPCLQSNFNGLQEVPCRNKLCNATVSVIHINVSDCCSVAWVSQYLIFWRHDTVTCWCSTTVNTLRSWYLYLTPPGHPGHKIYWHLQSHATCRVVHKVFATFTNWKILKPFVNVAEKSNKNYIGIWIIFLEMSLCFPFLFN